MTPQSEADLGDKSSRSAGQPSRKSYAALLATYCVTLPCTLKLLNAKCYNTKTAVSQKYVNILATDFAGLFRTVHKSVASCFIYSTYAEMTEMQTSKILLLNKQILLKQPIQKAHQTCKSVFT